jgi:hypothetical protein
MMGRRTRLLSRTFFGRLFETDLFSSPVSASSSLTWMLAALATPGVMVSGSQLYFYAHARTFEPALLDRIMFVSQAFHVDFAMAVAGLVTMLVWTSLTPDRLDALVLGPLPLHPGEQARARLAALVRFFAMFASAVALPTAVVFTLVTVGESSAADVAARMAGHATATFLGAAFVFFALVDVQLVLAATLGPRAVRVATWPLQAAAGHGRRAVVHAAPGRCPAGFQPGGQRLGDVESRRLVRRRLPLDGRRSARGLRAARVESRPGVCGGGRHCAGGLSIGLQRCLRKAIAGEGRRGAWWSGAGTRLWLASLAPVLRTPLERGLAAFITATLTRSHAHRFLIGSYAGVALLCALPLAGRLLGSADTDAARYAWFSVPLGLLCWTAASLRVAMMLPVEPASNWVFKLTEPVDKRRVLSTAVTVIAGATAVPLALVFGAAAGVAGGPTLGLTVFAVVLAAGLALIELVTLTLRTVPFTSTYRPGQLRLRVLWPVYLAVWLVIAYRLPVTAVAAVGHVDRSLWLVGLLVSMWAALRVWRLERARHLRGFVYEEVEPSVTTTINLGSVGA